MYIPADKDWLAQNQNEVSEWSNVYIPADKDWLAQNQNEVSEWSNVYIPADKDWLAQNQNEVLFHCASTIKLNPTTCFDLVQRRHDHHLIDCNLFSP